MVCGMQALAAPHTLAGLVFVSEADALARRSGVG
jgi:hypothetical protein